MNHSEKFKRSQAAHHKGFMMNLEKNLVVSMYHNLIYEAQRKVGRILPRKYKEKTYESVKETFKNKHIINGVIVKKNK